VPIYDITCSTIFFLCKLVCENMDMIYSIDVLVVFFKMVIP